MKGAVTVLAILTAVLAEISLIPMPKSLQLGVGHADVPQCAVELSFSDSTDSELKSLALSHMKMILGEDQQQYQCKKEYRLEVVQLLREPKDAKCASEKYSLTVDSSHAKIEASCGVGLVRAIATLYQLVTVRDSRIHLSHLPIIITDSPRFQHRGFMIDTARHFLSLDTIKRVIKGMMIAKLNVLHWHIVDDDSFPMQSRNIPGLGEQGAFSPSMMYTIPQIKEIVEFARTHGVRVIPEIDCPGHSIAVGKYEPLRDIVTCWDSIWPHRGLEKEGLYRIHGGPPTGALDPSMDLSYEFVEKVLKDLLEYFEDDLIHLGGDEVVYNKCWGSRESIKEFMKKHNIPDYPHLMNYFVDRVRGILVKLDSKKKTVYWSNSATFNLKYRDGDVLQYWGDSASIHRLKELYPRNKFIMSPFDYFYLDCGIGNRYGGPSWCGDFKSWIRMYLFEPTNYGVPEEEILGGEACGWAELDTDSNLELRLWPRLAAMAETLWLPKRTSEVDLVSLVKRLTAFSAKLNELGIPTDAITRQYCEIHPDLCFAKSASEQP